MQWTALLVIFALAFESFGLPVPIEHEHRDQLSSVKKTAEEIEEELEDMKDEIGVLKARVKQSEEWAKDANSQSSQQQMVRLKEVRETVVETLVEYFHDKIFDKATKKIVIEKVAGHLDLSSPDREKVKAQLSSRLKTEETISGHLQELVKNIIDDIKKHNLEGKEAESFIKLMVEQDALREHWEEVQKGLMLKLVRGTVLQKLHPNASKWDILTVEKMEKLEEILEKKAQEKGLTQQESLLVQKILHQILTVAPRPKPNPVTTMKSSSVEISVEKLREPQKEQGLKKQSIEDENIEMTVEKITTPDKKTAAPEESGKTMNAATNPANEKKDADVQDALDRLRGKQEHLSIDKEEKALEDELEHETLQVQVEKITKPGALQPKESTVQVERVDAAKQPDEKDNIEMTVEKITSTPDTKTVEPTEIRKPTMNAVTKPAQEKEEANLQAALEMLRGKQDDSLIDNNEKALEEEMEFKTRELQVEKITKPEALQPKESTVQVERIDAAKQPDGKDNIEMTVEKITTQDKKKTEAAKYVGQTTTIAAAQSSTEKEEASLQEALDNLRGKQERISIDKEEKALEDELEHETRELQVEKITKPEALRPKESTVQVERIDAAKQPDEEDNIEMTVEKITSTPNTKTVEPTEIRKPTMNAVTKPAQEKEETNLQAALEMLRGKKDDSLIDNNEKALEEELEHETRELQVEKITKPEALQPKESTVQVERIDAAKQADEEDNIEMTVEKITTPDKKKTVQLSEVVQATATKPAKEKKGNLQEAVENLQGKQEFSLISEKEAKALEDELELERIQVDKLTQEEDRSMESTIQVDRIDTEPDKEDKINSTVEKTSAKENSKEIVVEKLREVKLQDSSVNENEKALEDERELEMRVVQVEKLTEPGTKASIPAKAELIVEKITTPLPESPKPTELVKVTVVAATTSAEGTDEKELVEKLKKKQLVDSQAESKERELEAQESKDKQAETERDEARILNNLSETSFDTSTDEGSVNKEQVAKEFEKALELERKKEEQAHSMRKTSPKPEEKMEPTKPAKATQLPSKEKPEKPEKPVATSNNEAEELAENQLEGINVNSKRDSVEEELYHTLEVEKTERSGDHNEKSPLESEVTLNREETQHLKKELQEELDEAPKLAKPVSKEKSSETNLTKSEGVHSIGDLVRELEIKDQAHARKVTQPSESRDKLEEELDELT